LLDEEASPVRNALQSIHLFSDVLDSAQLDQLACDCQPVHFDVDAILMRQGEHATTMYCIVAGLVSLQFVDHLQRVRNIRELGAGSVVGEIELLTGAPRLATVTAASEVEALEISKGALESVFSRSPDLLESFAANVALREQMLRNIADDPEGAWKAKILREARKVFPPNLRRSARRHW
jgi:CRP-like cAMP-binding protein